MSRHQGDAWNFQSISIPRAISVGSIRIVATKSDNAIRNDIAIDQIKLIGVDTVSPIEYYIDLDQDGFGIAESIIFSCETSPPNGYADNSDDCDDSNPLINPSATEINCNLIDENCNGNGDDVDLAHVVPYFLNGQFLVEGVHYVGEGLKDEYPKPIKATDKYMNIKLPYCNCQAANGCVKTTSYMQDILKLQQKFMLDRTGQPPTSFQNQLKKFKRKIYRKILPSWMN